MINEIFMFICKKCLAWQLDEVRDATGYNGMGLKFSFMIFQSQCAGKTGRPNNLAFLFIFVGRLSRAETFFPFFAEVHVICHATEIYESMTQRF